MTVTGWVAELLAGIGTVAPIIAVAAEESAAVPSRAALEQQLTAAQQRLNEAAREVAVLNRSLSGSENRIISGTFGNVPDRRAVLGINIGPFSETATEDGVEIINVSPGGPAAVAGLQAGDVLLEIKGRKLTRAGERSPRATLLQIMDDVAVGEKVAVSYRRDRKLRKAEVQTRRIEPEMFSMPLPPPPPGFPAPGFRPGPRVMRSFGPMETLFGSAEMVALTPKLSQYFGTDKGLLVVRAPEGAGFKLEDGDVLLSVDGREPSSPVHALRILGSYQPGEKLKLEVVRLKRRMTLDVTVPDRAGFEPSSFRPALPAEDVLFVTPFERT
jgi:S1-C subfamily serine protease